jgi:putative hydrolases of HD superfamily
VEPLTSQLEFIAEAGRLKAVTRQTMLTFPPRRENSAEHSWHLTVMAIVFAGYAPPGTDLSRVIAMLVLHDIVEVDAGDLFVYAGEADQEKQRQAEEAAAQRIFGLLPADQGSSLRELWNDFEERGSPEARFARALDRLQPMLENVKAAGGTWQEHGVTADRVLANVALIEEGSAVLGQYARSLIRQAVEDGMLAPPAPAS